MAPHSPHSVSEARRGDEANANMGTVADGFRLRMAASAQLSINCSKNDPAGACADFKISGDRERTVGYGTYA